MPMDSIAPPPYFGGRFRAAAMEGWWASTPVAGRLLHFLYTSTSSWWTL
jgi:hypothetical protein